MRTAKKYINAISSFFGYLREENILKISNLYVELEKNTRREESYVARMTYYIETCSQLKEKKPINCIDSVRAKELLTWCDKQLSSEAFWTEDDYLFTSKAGKAWNGNTSSSGIPDYLNRQFGSRDLTGIIKYGIGQLLLAGLSDHLVKEITGASDDLIKGSVSKEDPYRELNNKIVTVELFYDF